MMFYFSVGFIALLIFYINYFTVKDIRIDAKEFTEEEGIQDWVFHFFMIIITFVLWPFLLYLLIKKVLDERKEENDN